jgi:hypothetical protein
VRSLHLRKKTNVRSEVMLLSFAAYLLDDGPDIWKAMLIICARPTISANHAVKFSMGPCLDLRV